MSENLVKILAAQVEELRRTLYLLLENHHFEHDRLTALQDRVLKLEMKMLKEEKNEM